MAEDNTTGLGNVIHIDDQRIEDHLGKIVRGSVEETLNALLDAEADRLVGAFPDGQSCLNLAAARLRHIAGTKWSPKRYLDVTLLDKHRLTA